MEDIYRRENIEPTQTYFGIGRCLSCGVRYQSKIVAIDASDARANFVQTMELNLQHRQDCVEGRLQILNLSPVSDFA